MLNKWTLCFALACSIFTNPLKAEVRGKVDVGAALLYIDILHSGKTEKTLQMNGVKADATVLVYKGLAIKPTFLYGEGGSHGWVCSGGVGVGFYYPVTDKFKVLPYAGMIWSDFQAKVVMEPFGPIHVKERFRSKSPYVGLDASYAITSKWTAILSYQYSWSRTVTTIKPFVKDKSHSDGPNYAAAIEYAVSDTWAVNFGVGYNISLSKEKHGLRGKGMKLGVAYYF